MISAATRNGFNAGSAIAERGPWSVVGCGRLCSSAMTRGVWGSRFACPFGTGAEPAKAVLPLARERVGAFHVCAQGAGVQGKDAVR